MTMHFRNHMEVALKLWEHSQGWFWLVVSPHSKRGTIGAAATKAEAISDARSLVEDLSAEHERVFAISISSA
jgi:hypothetical protein